MDWILKDKFILESKCGCTYFLSIEGVLHGGSAVELQGGQGGQGIRQSVGGQAKRTQADPSSLLQATHQCTATSSHHLLRDYMTDMQIKLTTVSHQYLQSKSTTHKTFFLKSDFHQLETRLGH